jgi:hypothetical protein
MIGKEKVGGTIGCREEDKGDPGELLFWSGQAELSLCG